MLQITFFEHASQVKYTEFWFAHCLPSSENLNGPLVFVLCTFRPELYKQRIFFLHTIGRSKPAKFTCLCDFCSLLFICFLFFLLFQLGADGEAISKTCALFFTRFPKHSKTIKALNWPNVLWLSSVFSCLELNLGKALAPTLSESKVLILSCCQDDIYNPRLNFDHLIRDCPSHLQTINFLVKHLLQVSCFGVPPLGMQ